MFSFVNPRKRHQIQQTLAQRRIKRLVLTASPMKFRPNNRSRIINTPLISCIVPTRNRPAQLRECIQMFINQTYPKKEMIIIDDSENTEPISDVAKWKKFNIRYFHLRTKVPIGKKRNIAIMKSSGEYIAIWDDDDFHGRTRLSLQMSRILNNYGDMTCMKNVVINVHEQDFKKPSMKYITCKTKSNQNTLFTIPKQYQYQIWFKGIINNSLLFPKIYWTMAQFPNNRNVGEDSIFLRKLFQIAPGIRVDRYNVPFVYNRNNNNTWNMNTIPHQYRIAIKCI